MSRGPRFAMESFGMAALLVMSGCAARPGAVPPPAAERAAEDETAIDDAWLEGAPPEAEEIAQDEALRFATATMDVVTRRLYDPALAAKHGERAGGEVRRALLGKPTWSRQGVVDTLNASLKSYGVSHLGIGTPTKVRALLGAKTADSAPAAKPAAVHGELRDGVGVVRIASFLVPTIRLASVTQAFASVKDARALLIDLRGNPGGSASSVVYTAQYIVGPKVLVESVRTRKGFERPTAHAMHGFFPDAVNEGSDADVRLNQREGYVTWWTPDDAPAAPRRPTYLLVDGACGSSCEIFAAAVADAGAAKVLGQRTAGSVLAAQGVRGRWKGYLIVVPFGTVLSPNGRTLEGKGVEPDVALAECDADANGADEARCLSAALAYAASGSH